MSASPTPRRRAPVLRIEPSAPTPAAAVPVMVMTLKETATAIRRSVRHVRRLIRSRRLPAKRDGRMVVVLPADVQTFLANLPDAG